MGEEKTEEEKKKEEEGGSKPSTARPQIMPDPDMLDRDLKAASELAPGDAEILKLHRQVKDLQKAWNAKDKEKFKGFLSTSKGQKAVVAPKSKLKEQKKELLDDLDIRNGVAVEDREADDDEVFFDDIAGQIHQLMEEDPEKFAKIKENL